MLEWKIWNVQLSKLLEYFSVYQLYDVYCAYTVCVQFVSTVLFGITNCWTVFVITGSWFKKNISFRHLLFPLEIKAIMRRPPLSAQIQHILISDIVEELFMHLSLLNYELPYLLYCFIIFLINKTSQLCCKGICLQYILPRLFSMLLAVTFSSGLRHGTAGVNDTQNKLFLSALHWQKTLLTGSQTHTILFPQLSEIDTHFFFFKTSPDMR